MCFKAKLKKKKIIGGKEPFSFVYVWWTVAGPGLFLKQMFLDFQENSTFRWTFLWSLLDDEVLILGFVGPLNILQIHKSVPKWSYASLNLINLGRPGQEPKIPRRSKVNLTIFFKKP